MRTDDELILAAGCGDRHAFAQLVERHHRAIIHFIHRFLGTADRAAAEDLAQQVFLNAWRYAPTFRPRAKVRTWLFRLTTNTCLSYRRSERARSLLRRVDAFHKPEHEAGDETGHVRLSVRERADEVRAAVAALPPNQRAVVVLRYFHEFSYADIADVMATSTSAVDSLLHRARQALFKTLGREKNGKPPQVSSP